VLLRRNEVEPIPHLSLVVVEALRLVLERALIDAAATEVRVHEAVAPQPVGSTGTQISR